eukprot:10579124-Alexandrium_andersonii.AAC.1
MRGPDAQPSPGGKGPHGGVDLEPTEGGVLARRVDEPLQGWAPRHQRFPRLFQSSANLLGPSEGHQQ